MEFAFVDEVEFVVVVVDISRGGGFLVTCTRVATVVTAVADDGVAFSIEEGADEDHVVYVIGGGAGLDFLGHVEAGEDIQGVILIFSIVDGPLNVFASDEVALHLVGLVGREKQLASAVLVEVL